MRNGFTKSFIAASLLVLMIGGCRADRPASVPAAATHVGGGFPDEHQSRIVWTAPANGTIYVTDDWDNSLLYTGPVHRGDSVVIARDAGRIEINGRVVLRQTMRHTDHHLLFLR